MDQVNPQHSLAHWKGCNCFRCTHPWMLPYIHEDIIGPEMMKFHLNYLDRLDAREDRPKEAHWASDGLFSCIRKEWLGWHGAVPTNSDFNSQILELGKSIEEDIIERYKLSGTMVGTDRYIKIQDPRLRYPITGKIDVLVVDGGVVLPVEVKSTKDNSEFKHYDAWKKLLPRGEHVAQLTVYLKARKLSRGRLHYMNKNRSLDAWYYVDFVEQFFDEIVAKFKEVEDSLPKPEPLIPTGLKSDTFPCSWYSSDRNKEEAVGKCMFWEHCHGEVPITLKFEQVTW